MSVGRRIQTVKAALLLGFGLTVALWLFAGIELTQRVVKLRQEASLINARHFEAQEALTVAGRQILLGSILARDAILSRTPRDAGLARRVDSSYGRADEALTRYVALGFSSAEQNQIAEIRRNLSGLRATMAEVLDETIVFGGAEGRAALLARARSRRELIDSFTINLERLNRRGFEEQQAEIAALYRGTRQHAWMLLALALVASVVIGAGAASYAGRLERRVRLQQDRDTRHSEDLRRLSARLVHVQEEERRAIARELHDEVGQVLTAIKVELAMAQRAVDASGGPAGVLGDVRTITDSALSTVRDLSRLLHPAILDDLGLQAAIEWQAHELTRRFGIDVALDSELNERLPKEVEITAYRVIQEALTNVAKHAKVRACRVQLRCTADQLVVAVEDRGVGFAVDAPDDPRRGLGFVGMRERVAELNGTFEIESAPGRGTRIVMSVPVIHRQAVDEITQTGAA